MKELTVNELINKLLKGITEGRLDGNTVIYLPDGERHIKGAKQVAVEKIGHIGRRVVLK